MRTASTRPYSLNRVMAAALIGGTALLGVTACGASDSHWKAQELIDRGFEDPKCASDCDTEASQDAEPNWYVNVGSCRMLAIQATNEVGGDWVLSYTPSIKIDGDKTNAAEAEFLTNANITRARNWEPAKPCFEDDSTAEPAVEDEP